MNYSREVERLRELAKAAADKYEDKKNTERIKRYKDINSLKHRPPPVHIHIPAHASEDLFQLTGKLKTMDVSLAGYEKWLLQILLRDEVLGDDIPVQPTVYTGFSCHVTGWMDGHKTVKMGSDLKSSFFEPCLNDADDLQKIKEPILIHNRIKSEENFEKACDIFGGILPVVMGYPYLSTYGWGDSVIDHLMEMRGNVQFYYDLTDNPEFIHAAMRKMTDCKLRLLKQFENEKMFVLNNCGWGVGSTSAGYTDELPGINYDPCHVRTCDLWGFAHAQELSEVSPAMLEEFILPYQAELLNGFGLVAYGCCEAMENKIESVSRYIKNLRMISISPFTNHEKAAEKCKGKFVYAWKPQPSYMIDFNEEQIADDLTRTLTVTKDCCVTVTLMDVYPYGGDVRRFKRYREIAHNVINKLF
ncbi:MAG: hypothetical protein FWE82_09330 [Defluviitaleaceae bacterium]|nr:hypothetical protein [Defluviitaleaceae bacterium]